MRVIAKCPRKQRHRGVLEVHAALRQHLGSLRDDAWPVMADDRDGERGHRGIVSPVNELQGNPIENVGLADDQILHVSGAPPRAFRPALPR